MSIHEDSERSPTYKTHWPHAKTVRSQLRDNESNAEIQPIVDSFATIDKLIQKSSAWMAAWKNR